MNLLPHSLRWRLQLWYGLILCALLGGFGFTAYQLERGRLFHDVDDGLQQQLGSLLHPPPPPHEGGPSQDEFIDPLFSPEPSGGRHPRRGMFHENNHEGFYYIIWHHDGIKADASALAPATMAFPGRSKSGTAPVLRTRAEFREFYVTLPPGETILVGRSIASELQNLQHVAWRLMMTGVVILLFGLAGGWWLATRAIRPIADISTAATKIALGDLSQRIVAEETDSELGQLALVLNSTFERLESVFAQQRQFTSDAAHELRTPVTVVLTQIQTALNRERTTLEYQQTLQACERAAQRMRRLLDSLLELTRLDAGQKSPSQTSFDLSQLAHDVVDMLHPLLIAKNITIQVDFSPVWCRGNSEQMTQVISNLLSNALQHNPENGEVRVTTRTEEKMGILSVRDTGPGIPEEHLPHIFKRFYRVDSARSASAGGTGLGLAISQSIAEVHGGSIIVTSQIGQGTMFTLRIPQVSSDN
jgi:two-component system, OmpR family, sensor kinase